MKTIQHSRRIWIIVLLAAVGLTACSPQPFSLVAPPQAVLESPLSDNRWRIDAATYQDAAVPLDAITPIYVMFNRLGTVVIYPDQALEQGERCPLVWYPITYQGKGQYQLAQGRQTFERCPADHAPQHTLMLAAFRLTQTYTLRTEGLTLSGPEATLHLVLDNP